MTRHAFAIVILSGALLASHAENTNVPPDLVAGFAAAEIQDANRRLEEQLQAAQLALERNRREAETASELLQGRLRLLEQALVGERARELEAFQDAQRLMLIFAGLFAGLGLAAALLTNYVQWRVLHRLTTASASSAFAPLATAGASLAPLSQGSFPPARGEAGDTTSLRLLAIIERLEQRTRELEQAVRPSVSGPMAAAPLAATATEQNATSENGAGSTAERAAQIELLMAKGQSLLDLGRAEEALACFDDVLRLDSRHAEALVKKGDALEQVRKPDEAIACYDRAIAADHRFTLAYLHKGGLYNRLERHEEALKCYEEALKTQEATSA